MSRKELKNIPERIYIQIGANTDGAADYKELEGCTFCDVRIYKNDVEYLRKKVLIDKLKITRGAMIMDGYEQEDSCIKYVDELIKEMRQ